MEAKVIYKVSAWRTRDFKNTMRELGLRADAPATILNVCSGFNYFYETEESYGDITEETALSMAEENNLEIIEL